MPAVGTIAARGIASKIGVQCGGKGLVPGSSSKPKPLRSFEFCNVPGSSLGSTRSYDRDPKPRDCWLASPVPALRAADSIITTVGNAAKIRPATLPMDRTAWRWLL